jgi:GntR family transcriptional regulator
MSAHYGVTLMTLRQALATLTAEGLIVQQPGKGTLVAPPQAGYRLATLRSLAEDLRDQGIEVSTQVLDRSLRRIPAWAATELGEGRALRLERLRIVGGQPAVHQVSWIAEPHGSAIRGGDFESGQLYAALGEIGVVVHSASEVIRPKILGPASAAVLGRPAETPVFVSERFTYDRSGTAVVADRAVILGSLMEIRAERSVARVDLHWHTPAPLTPPPAPLTPPPA